jgi:2-polyprenyl-3-methyl-5-hydroxy-6-metoxy-1,4-benzoquinol methylase
VSLELIEHTGISRAAAIIDVGGGGSTLADDLLERGFENISVLDISAAALAVSKERLGKDAARIRWMAGNITEVELEPSSFDVWHDRAVFHFLLEPSNRAAYIRQMLHSLKPGGQVIIATFGPEGPLRCSGLNVVRYDASALLRELGDNFRLLESSTDLHQTPSGATQQFLYCRFRRE